MPNPASFSSLIILSFYSLLPLIPLYQLAKHLNVHNPASPFFFLPDSQVYGDAFQSPHSDHRISKGLEFIRDYSLLLKEPTTMEEEAESRGAEKMDEGMDFKISIGVVSVNRPEGIHYLDSCLGSILESLTIKERNRLHLSTFIADLNPKDHPFFKEKWLWDLSDEVIVRQDSEFSLDQEGKKEEIEKRKIRVNTLPSELMKRLQTSGNGNERKSKTSPWHQKESLDYTTTLSSCLNQGSNYCLILEDDVVLKRDWFKILQGYIQEAERRESKKNKSVETANRQLPDFSRLWNSDSKKETFKPWVFMRLFYAEKYFGWEDYEVKTIVRDCLFYLTAFFLSILLLKSASPFKLNSPSSNQTSVKTRKSIKASPSSRFNPLSTFKQLSIPQLLFFSFIIIPYFLLLILSGRNNHPSHSTSYGLSRMNERGCCTQALLFKATYLQGLIDYLEREENFTRRPKDLLAIEYALNGDLKDGLDEEIKEEKGEGSFKKEVGNGFGKEKRKSEPFKGGEILAVRPMLTQHIGHSSSRNKGFNRKSRVWGFGFEREWDERNW